MVVVGAGKTRFFVKPNIMQCNCSFVVLDPKGEILRDTGNLLEKEGLIERNGFFDSTGGRKAHAIQIVADFKISIGVGILKNMFQFFLIPKRLLLWHT